MDRPIDISEVISRTGLTARALRFYEARGLVAPLRTASGRRLYGPGELGRLNQVVTLKAAGFSLADIGRLIDRKPVDLRRMIAAQLEALEAQAATVAEAKRLLLSAKSRVDRGEPLDAATLCSLIKNGKTNMEQNGWQAVMDRHFSPEEKAHWRERVTRDDFDLEDYQRQWRAMGAKIADRLPLDPASDEAQALLDECRALLAPLTPITPEMRAGATRLYANIAEWKAEKKPPFPAEVLEFVQAASAAGGSRASYRVGTGSAPE